MCVSWSCSVSARSVFRCFLSQLSSCLQFVSLFPATHLEFSSIGAFLMVPVFFCVSLPHAWTRNVSSVYGIFVSVAVFSVLVPSVVSGSRRCGCHVCFIEEWMYGAVYRVFCSTLESRERECFSLLVDWDDQQLLNAGLHLSGPRTVLFWYGSNRCQQLLLSLDLLCEFSRLLCVFVLRGILSWLLFVWCCGCLAAGHLACRNDVAPASAWTLLFLGSASICDSSQLASSLHGLEFPIYWLCQKKTQQKNEKTAIKKERRKKNKQKKDGTYGKQWKKRTIKM